jgi:hypothetical protein
MKVRRTNVKKIHFKITKKKIIFDIKMFICKDLILKIVKAVKNAPEYHHPIPEGSA